MDDAQKQQFQLLAAKFEEWLKAINFSKQSIENYCGDLQRFISWIEENTNCKTVIAINPQHLQQYQIALYNTEIQVKEGKTKRLTPGTQLRKLAAIRKFFSWLVLTNQIAYNPAASLQLPKKAKSIPSTLLTKAEVKRLIEATTTQTAVDCRDRAIIELLYATGIRRAELLNLSLYDLDLEGATLSIKEGKRKDSRIIPLTNVVIEILKLYINESRPKFPNNSSKTLLFISSRSGGKLDAADVDRILQKAIAKAGIKKHVTPHTLRHSFATHLLKGKADIRQVQKLLGHRRLSSTEIYTRVEVSDLKEVLQRCHPRADKKL
jgi:site-specific recombinase XerD